MKTAKKFNKGTALLVTVLLAGAVGALAFGLFKIANSEFFIGTKEEEGIEAFYAAQAGVEDALMRFKFKTDGSLEIPDGANEDSTAVIRIDANGSNQSLPKRIEDYKEPIEPNENEYIYDLKVWSKVKRIDLTLEKDQSIILDVSEPSERGENIFVRWEAEGTNPAIKDSAKLWYRLSDPEGASQDPRGQLKRDFFTYLAYQQDNLADANGNPINPARRPGSGFNVSALPANTNNNNFSLYNFKTLKFKAFGETGSRIHLIVRTLGNSDSLIGGPKIYIESTGYYGNTARKIKVTLDRESKSVLDIFDYVIYSGDKSLP